MKSGEGNRQVFLALAMTLFIAVPLYHIQADAAWVELSDDDIEVTEGRTLVNRLNRTFYKYIHVTNKSEQPIPEGLRIFITSNKEVLNADGFKGTGEPFFIIADQKEILQPNASTKSILVEFAMENPREPARMDIVSVQKNDDMGGSGDSDMFRKNVSKTPELASAKAKLNSMTVYVPTQKADGTPVDRDAEGNCMAGQDIPDPVDPNIKVCMAKPLVITYSDEIAETGAAEAFAAISRDDGATWKRMNLSRTADRSSFTLANGNEAFGDSRKPVFQAKGNYVLVAWTDKFCKAGSPRYSLPELNDDGTDKVDPVTGETIKLYDDFYGVAGNQKSVDYTLDKDLDEQKAAELGEVPFSCVWTSRIVVDKETGGIQVYKAERLTSGRRDALQLFMGAAENGGFAISWQEDPEGLRPGGGDGPGTGMSGATTNHKTDIWYSFVPWGQFEAEDLADVSEGDQDQINEDGTPRIRALHRMSMPVRISDNDTCNMDNIAEDKNGHLYCLLDVNGQVVTEDAPNAAMLNCVSTMDKTNEQSVEKDVCVTSDGRWLDGDTGASRPNLFLQFYTKKTTQPDGSTISTPSAWAILAYEETKGLGVGAPDVTGEGKPEEEIDPDDLGKNVLYHSFDFQQPDTVAAGGMVNLPQLDADGNPIVLMTEPDANGGSVPATIDGTGKTLYATENARRIRFILQGKSPAMGKDTDDNGIGDSGAGTVLLAVYKQGMEGKGRPSDIMLRRMSVLIPDTCNAAGKECSYKGGNPYAFANFKCEGFNGDAGEMNAGQCIKGGALNMSSVGIVTTEPPSQDDAVPDGDGGEDTYDKLVEWDWSTANFDDESWVTPMTEARAHRGQIRGDRVVMGYSWTPNWAASRNGKDKFDLFVRRSFDGGLTWTTAPADQGGTGVEHCRWVKLETGGGDQTGADVKPQCSTILPGDPEPPRNVSLLKNASESVVEPRIVAVPGTIKNAAGQPITAEDKQNPLVYMVSYGLEVNYDTNVGQDEITPEPLPTDMYYARTTDFGESYEMVEKVNSNTGETEQVLDWLAKRDGVAEGEAQLRLTPDGTKFYSTWLSESDETIDEGSHFFGSDIWFRKIDYNL